MRNITQLGASRTLTTFTYDSSDRNLSVADSSNKVVYIRDSQGRLTNRKVTIKNATTSYNYGYTGSGDTPDLMKNDSGTVLEKYLQLPGNVLLTIRPTQTTTENKQVFSLPNIHGDVMATTSTSGVLTGRYMTGPYGEVLSASVTKVTGQTTTPGNTTASTFSYVGQNEKFTEDTFTLQPVQMGARVYIPSLGRFIQVDPVDGGTPNNYVYPNDPVNDFDLSGRCAGPAIFLLPECIAIAEEAVAAIDGTVAAGAGSVALGRAGENAVSRIISAPKNTRNVVVNGRVRIPDFMTRNSIHEVKNVKSLSHTRQIKDYQKIAQRSGKKLVLWTRKTTRLSNPLHAQVRKGFIIHRHLPW